MRTLDSERRHFLSQSLAWAGGLAAAPVILDWAAAPALAQAPTTFNAATDKLDRTQAGPITRPMQVEIAPDTYFLNEFGMDAQ